MLLEKYHPFSELEKFHSVFNRLLDESFLNEPALADLSRNWFPNIDIYKEKNDLVVKAELPGIEKEDVKVKVSDNILTISGNRKSETETKETDFCRKERFEGSFQRAIELPYKVDLTKADATYKDGILEIRFSLHKEEQEKSIDIEIK